MSPAKTDEPIEVLFGTKTWVGARNHVLSGGRIPPRKRQFSRDMSRPIVKYERISPYCKFHVIESIASILTKFGVTIETIKWSSWVVPVGAQQIQDGGWPPLKKPVKSPFICDRSTDLDEI